MKLALSAIMLCAAALLLIVFLPYAAGYGHHRVTLLQTLMKHWSDPTWQHGALAFPIAAYLVWSRRESLAKMVPQPSAAGLPLMVVSMLLYYAGYKAHLIYFGFGAVQVFAAGACVWLFGWERARACVFPWMMLTFAWPLLFLEESLAFHLRLLMVSCAGWVLDVIGVNVIREGTALVSAPNHAAGIDAGALFKLNIDAPCSGLRSLFALMMVSALFAYHRQRLPWKRWTLFLCSLPLAVIANMARIFVLIAASAMFGQAFAVGDEEKEVSTFHFLSGIVVFIVALGGLELISSVLNRLHRQRQPMRNGGAQATDSVLMPRVRRAEG
ncbi:MAG: exosortase/archaeosortase family protein [Verrucomicrobiaceae bacterium]|nr:exosortase/archaeosortase family protein [Verrucomicrobiaceae bacterium]